MPVIISESSNSLFVGSDSSGSLHVGSESPSSSKMDADISGMSIPEIKITSDSK